MSETALPFGARFGFAFACFFRVLFDGAFAARASAVRDAMPEPPPPKELPAKPKKERAPEPKPEAGATEADRRQAERDGALALLAALQRDGRLVDFLEQDVAGFPDAEIGAAARVVHEGSRKALRRHVVLEAVRAEQEEAKVTLEEGFDANAVKLTGNVAGKPPYAGVLRHRGWRAADVKLPAAVKGHDPRIVAPAEVEM